MKNMIPRISVFLRIAGVCCILAGIGLCIWNIYDMMRAERVVAIVHDQLLEQQYAHNPEDVWRIEDNMGIDDAPLYIQNPQMEMPIQTIDGQDYIGILQIPSFGLSLPIIDQWSYPSLRIAPCRYDGSAYMDNFIIAAHNYTSHFSHLKDLEAGDEIRFTDNDGNVFHYEVIMMEILEPTAIEEMKSSEWDLTLFTCTVGGSYRVTVRCKKIKSLSVCANREVLALRSF